MANFLNLPVVSFPNTAMSDDKSNVGMQDDIRVDVNDRNEVEYLHRQFPKLTQEQIREAIRSKGPLRSDIISYLKRI